MKEIFSDLVKDFKGINSMLLLTAVTVITKWVLALPKQLETLTQKYLL